MRSIPLTPGQENLLREISHEVASLESKLKAAKAQRNNLIISTHQDGASIYSIALVTELTRAYLGKMIKRITGAET